MKESLTAEKKKEIIATKMGEILAVLGLDTKTNPSLADTPYRIAKMYVDEIFSGLNPEKFPKLTFQEENVPNELVLVKNISFVSYCEHHFVPIVGKAHVAYFPNKRVIGLSKIPRLVHYCAQRPQIQERLTTQIADLLSDLLKTEDVAVVLQAVHFCVVVRGVKDLTADMETHVLKGRFEKDSLLRSEFFSRINRSLA